MQAGGASGSSGRSGISSVRGRSATAAGSVIRLAIAVALFVGLGLLLSPAADAANGSVVYTYDALGRISTASYDTGVFVIYAYDANGNRVSQTINVNATTGTWGSFNWGAALW